MQFDPLCLQIRHPLFPQPRIVQCALYDPVATHPPVSATTATGLAHLLRADAQRDEMPPPCARSLPLFPVTQPHASPQPLVQLQHLSIGVADTEIIQPTHRVTPQLFQPSGHRDAPTASGNLLDPFLEPSERLVRPHHPASLDHEAKESATTQRRRLTLLAVDHQTESALHKPNDALHDPLGSAGAFDQNQEIV